MQRVQRLLGGGVIFQCISRIELSWFLFVGSDNPAHSGACEPARRRFKAAVR
jgi:hypothetical protein